MKKSLLLLVVLFCTMSYSAFAQKVSGKVTGADKEPLPGAYVLVKGTSTGTVTDEKGEFSLNTALTNTLVFSFTGFQTLEEPINGRNVVDV